MTPPFAIATFPSVIANEVKQSMSAQLHGLPRCARSDETKPVVAASSPAMTTTSPVIATSPSVIANEVKQSMSAQLHGLPRSTHSAQRRANPGATEHTRGAALLSAMLTVALVATLAAASLWQQWRSVEVESAERLRVQSLWVLIGAQDWARLILREDGRNGGADHLAEPWAVPLAEARLSTFLAADKGAAMDSETLTQTFLSGQITDLHARLNVRNLIEGGKVSLLGWQAFEKLFEKLQLPLAELNLLTENLRFALDTSAENGSTKFAPLMPRRASQLGWLGLSNATLAVLSPYITLLPEATKVNLNTADAMVLYASIPTLDLAQAQRLVSVRQLSHFRTVADAASALGLTVSQMGASDVSSSYFEVHGRLRQDQTVVEQVSVVQRNGSEVKTLWRDAGPQWQPGKPLK